MKKIILASNNKHKIKEFNEVLTDYEILSLNDIGFVEDIVEDGDTLAKISKKVYGDISHVDDICRMNGLSDGNLIFIGQKLLLP